MISGPSLGLYPGEVRALELVQDQNLTWNLYECKALFVGLTIKTYGRTENFLPYFPFLLQALWRAIFQYSVPAAYCSECRHQLHSAHHIPTYHRGI